MATYSIPYQNLNFNIADQGELFRNGEDSWDSALYKRVGNQIYAFNIEDFAVQQDPSQANNPGRAAFGWEILKEKYGIDRNKIKTYRGADIPDMFSVMPPQTIKDLSIFKEKTPVVKGEVITKTIDPTNPHRTIDVSSLSGQTPPPPPENYLQNLLGGQYNAGGTPPPQGTPSQATTDLRTQAINQLRSIGYTSPDEQEIQGMIQELQSKGGVSTPAPTIPATSTPQQVTILVNGQPTTVMETTPGLFGQLGYQYANQGATATPPVSPVSAPVAIETTSSTGLKTPTLTPTTKPLSAEDPSTLYATGYDFSGFKSGDLVKINGQMYHYSGNNKVLPARPASYASFQEAQTPEVPIAQGQTSSETVTGDPILDETLKSMQAMIDKLLASGQTVNPYIDITPEKVAEFTAQAQREIDPYYASQLKLAREGFLRSVGYTTEELGKYEADLERKYGTQVRQLGEQAAEQGFALSGLRKREETELAYGTQQDIESKRRALGYETGTQARQFAQQWGGGDMSIPTISQAPRVLAGEMGFQRSGEQTPFYQLSPETYQGLIGSKEWEQKAAKQTRVSQLESAWKESELAKQYRKLTL